MVQQISVAVHSNNQEIMWLGYIKPFSFKYYSKVSYAIVWVFHIATHFVWSM